MKQTDLIGLIVNSDLPPLSSHRAVLWGRDNLLVKAVISFLKKSEWEVIWVIDDGNVEDLIREVGQVNPQVVLLCQDRANDSAMPFRLIDEQPCLKVVRLSLESNLMQVYSKQFVILQSASDLLTIFENEHVPNCIPGKEGDSKKENL